MRPRRIEVLRVGAERVGDAVDVVEVGDHLRRVVDRPIVEAGGPERLDVGAADSGRRTGQLLGIGAERQVDGRERRAAPVALDRGDEGVGLLGRP